MWSLTNKPKSSFLWCKMAPKAKKGVVQPTKPTPAAPISFYGGSAARPQLVKRGDGFVRTGAEAANAPLIGEREGSTGMLCLPTPQRWGSCIQSWTAYDSFRYSKRNSVVYVLQGAKGWWVFLVFKPKRPPNLAPKPHHADWASKAKYADGGAKVAPANRPPRLPFKSYALYVKECREALLNDPETRAMYRDGMPAAVLMAEAQAKARAGWKELSEEARGAYQAAAVGELGGRWATPILEYRQAGYWSS